ncbi:MAG: Putative DNA helicase ino80 [Sporothrix epigloea]
MDNFHSTVLGRSHDGTSNGGSGGDWPIQSATGVSMPDPAISTTTGVSTLTSSYPLRQPYASSMSLSTSPYRVHDPFAVRSPSKPEYRPLASPNTDGTRRNSSAHVGPAVTSLLNNSPPLQHRAPPPLMSRSRSPLLAPPRINAPPVYGDKASGSFYDPTTDTTTGTSSSASPSIDRHMPDPRHRRVFSQSTTASSQPTLN